MSKNCCLKRYKFSGLLSDIVTIISGKPECKISLIKAEQKVREVLRYCGIRDGNQYYLYDESAARLIDAALGIGGSLAAFIDKKDEAFEIRKIKTDAEKAHDLNIKLPGIEDL